MNSVRVGDMQETGFARLLVSSMFVVLVGLDACGAPSNGAQSTPSAETKLAIATDTEFRTAGMTALIVGTMRGTVNDDGTA